MDELELSNKLGNIEANVSAIKDYNALMQNRFDSFIRAYERDRADIVKQVAENKKDADGRLNSVEKGQASVLVWVKITSAMAITALATALKKIL